MNTGSSVFVACKATNPPGDIQLAERISTSYFCERAQSPASGL